MSNYRLSAQAYRRQAWRTATAQTTATVIPIGSAVAAGSAPIEVPRAA